METTFRCGGIDFTMLGRVFVKEYFSNFYMTFNAGSLAGVDTIEYNITPYGSSDGAAFQEIKLTEAYADMKVEFGDYFNSLYTATGRYNLYLRLSKNNMVVDGYNHDFYFCKYGWYQMGITIPNQVRSVFRPAVFGYSQAGLHVDAETAVAKYVEFEIGGYTERRKVHNGTASADLSEYLRQIFKDINPWNFESINSYYNFISDNQLYKYYSVIIKLIDASGRLIGVDEWNMDCFYNVDNYFEKYNVFNAAGKWRKRMVYWNMPFTFDMFIAPTMIGDMADFDMGLTFKKPYQTADGMAYGGIFNGVNYVNQRSIAVDFKKFIAFMSEGAFTTFDLNFAINHGFYICSNNGIDFNLTPSAQIGIDCEFSTSTCGVYLRWISRFGEHCYWMFKEGAATQETKTASEFKRLNTAYEETTVRNVETSKTMKIGDAVKDDYLDFLASLADGWAVQMYNASDGTWTDVEVQDSKITYGTAAAGNTVELEIAFPQTNIKL